MKCSPPTENCCWAQSQLRDSFYSTFTTWQVQTKLWVQMQELACTWGLQIKNTLNWFGQTPKAGLTSLLMLLLSSPPSDWQVPDELFYIPLRSLQAARGRDDPELQIPLLLFKAANPGLRPCTSVRLSVCLPVCLSPSHTLWEMDCFRSLVPKLLPPSRVASRRVLAPSPFSHPEPIDSCLYIVVTYP